MTGTVAVRAGLCSITFRSLTCEEIIDAVVAARLDAVEWGADVHIGPGDLGRAAEVARRCRDAGLLVPSYGSYLLAHGLDTTAVPAVLDAAEALGASTVRIWTPFGTLPDAAETERDAVVDAVASVAVAAAARGIQVALEFHPFTLTHHAAGARDVLARVGAPNLWTYWQPEPGHTDDDRCLAELHTVAARLAHLHVFSWGPGGFTDRLPLETRTDLWTAALAGAAEPGEWRADRFAYLEHVAGDSLDAFRRDAATLRRWLTPS